MHENGYNTILIVDDIEEVRDVLQSLLESDGYRVNAARSKEYAIESALRQSPELILMNVAGLAEEVIAAARHISQNARLGDRVPIVLFCIEGMEEQEVHLGGGLYSVRPDNFNVLRQLLNRLLCSPHAE